MSLAELPASGPRPLVCIQGLGFVGAAMAAAVAKASHADGSPCFDVIGVDLDSPDGRGRVEAVGAGRFPFATVDEELVEATRQGHQRGNLTATTDPTVYEKADVVVVDIHLDVDTARGFTDFTGFRAAIRCLAERVKPGCLILVETTVPPGTCARVVAPELAAGLKARGLAEDAVLLAHSYERVMPGPNYLESIIRFWRVYSGHTPAAAAACRAFLERVIDTQAYPLVELGNTTASETAKVMENTYRAVTIALMDEWGRFAESAGIDMFEIVRAIRYRPTHSNIRQPGFGVGGYCLTKDPLFGLVAARQLWDNAELDFPVSRLAVQVNQQMPLHVFDLLRARLGGLKGRRLLLLGVAYRSEVDDTRYSPSEVFLRAARDAGAAILCRDPHVRSWPELGLEVSADWPAAQGLDAVVLAVDHADYRQRDTAFWLGWLGSARPLLVDGNNVLTDAVRQGLAEAGITVVTVGRG